MKVRARYDLAQRNCFVDILPFIGIIKKLTMKGSKILLLLLFVICCFSCSTYHVVSSWKAPRINPRPYAKILVVGIIKDTSLQLRQSMETHLVNDLKDLGYTSVSALDEFGPNGLANMEQEQTYHALCNKGIDGVITIALLDKHKEQVSVRSPLQYQSNLYYYNRIWNYQKIQADIGTLPTNYTETTSFLWESIFYDVTTLEPVYVVRSKSFDFASIHDQAHVYGKSIISDMLKQKIVYQQKAKTTDQLKAF